MQAVDIGAISQVIIGHDLIGRGKGWYLEGVTIESSQEPGMLHLFPCNRSADSLRLACGNYHIAHDQSLN